MCPICKDKGEVGTLCDKCSDLSMRPDGICPNCGDDGKVGQLCDDCDCEMVEEVMMGECQGCHGIGEQGTICQICKDQGSPFE
jgi:hypothetical protein